MPLRQLKFEPDNRKALLPPPCRMGCVIGAPDSRRVCTKWKRQSGIRDEITAIHLSEVAGKKKPPDLRLFQLAQILAK